MPASLTWGFGNAHIKDVVLALSNRTSADYFTATLMQRLGTHWLARPVMQIQHLLVHPVHIY